MGVANTMTKGAGGLAWKDGSAHQIPSTTSISSIMTHEGREFLVGVQYCKKER